MAETPVIEIRDLTFAYDGHDVLRRVDLTITSRDYVCVVGPNGGGKTTLLKLMLGLLQPQQGTVRVFGLTPAAARPRSGYMPQYAQVDPLFPVSVMDVVLMGCLRPGRRTPWHGRADRAACARALEEVQLYDLRRRPFRALSGGQRQRVLIARALAGEPDLLLLDEPMSNLDLHVEMTLRDLLVRLNERMTVVTVSHDLGFVSRFVKRVACVNRGVAVHPTSELTGEMISELYGADMRLVRHDHFCAEKGHEWRSS